MRLHQEIPSGTTDGSYVACPECDLLQREVSLPPRGVALCGRCHAELYRNTPNGLDRTLAFSLCALVLYCIANLYPLIELDLNGNHITTTLYGAVQTLYDQKLAPIAILVFITTILVPGLELISMLYILLPLRAGIIARGFSPVFRFIQLLHPWGMVEVFMLGVLVSVVRLSNFATVVPGIALWSFAALMSVFTAVAQSFNPRDIWNVKAAQT